MFRDEYRRFPIMLMGGGAGGEGAGDKGAGGTGVDGGGGTGTGTGGGTGAPGWLSAGWATGEHAPLAQSKSLAEIKANTIEEAIPLLAKGYDNQAKMIGDRVAIPKPDAAGKIDEKVQREFWTKLGVPADVTGYKDLRLEPIEGLGPMNEKLLEAAKPALLKAGMTPRQGQDMLNLYREVTSRQRRELAETFVQQQAELEERWGLNFESNFNLAQRALKKYFPPTFIKLLADSQLDLHPGMIEGFYNMGQNLGEARFLEGNEATVADKDADDKAIADLRKEMLTMNQGTQMWKDSQTKLEAIYKKRFGTGPVGPQR